VQRYVSALAAAAAGDPDVRRALYEAASALLTRFKRKDKVKSWGLALARRGCHRKAVVAVARKLAVIMHAMWLDGTFYCGDPAARAADVTARASVKPRKENSRSGRSDVEPANNALL
jgi:transposase